MTIRYRYGWPLGKTLARLGIPTGIRIDVLHDAEAQVFVGTSKDVRGLVVEAQTLDELLTEARELIPLLLEPLATLPRSTIADVHFQEHLRYA